MTADPHALDLPPRDPAPPVWWQQGAPQVRRGPDHTDHWHDGTHADRELTRERGMQ